MAIYRGLKNIDPIRGLVEYVQDIKPFHTKIINVLVEYVYEDIVNIIVKDSLETSINLRQDSMIDTSITELAETLTFAWGAPQMFQIVGIEHLTNSIFIPGNISSIIRLGDFTSILNSTDNDGTYTIVNIVFNPSTQRTQIFLDSLSGTSGDGNLLLEQVDISWYYNFTIINMDEPSQQITLIGNATRDIQIGSEFQILGAPFNNGRYQAQVIKYDLLENKTTITVGSSYTPSPYNTIQFSTEGGFVEPYRFYSESNQGTFDLAFDQVEFNLTSNTNIHLK